MDTYIRDEDDFLADPPDVAPSAPPRGFWRRNFTGPVTRRQRVFDVMFGVVAPIICLVFDPIVFTGFYGRGILSVYKALAYLFMAFEMLVLIAWMSGFARSSQAASTASGILLAGGLGSLAVGIAIFPISLFGMIVVVGVMGFTPLFTSFVFFRNAVRARRQAAWDASGLLLYLPLLAGFMLAASFPIAGERAAHRLMDDSIDKIASAESADEGLKMIRFLIPLSGSDDLIQRHGQETDPVRKARLSAAYERLTGRSVDHPHHHWMD